MDTLTPINQLPKGTAVKRRAFCDMVWHYGILVDGGCVVSVYKTADKIVRQSFEEFEDGQRVHIAHEINWNPSMAYREALNTVGQPFNYCPIFNNCEHFVSKAHGQRRSGQTQMGIASFVAGAFIGKMLSNNNDNDKPPTPPTH